MTVDQRLEVCRECGGECCRLTGVRCTKDERDAVLAAGFADSFSQLGPDHFETKSVGTRCHFLTEETTCGIYDLRPTACRCWPVSPAMENGKRVVYLMQCPLAGLLTEEEVEEMTRLVATIPDEIAAAPVSMSKNPPDVLRLVEQRLNQFPRRPL